MKKELRSYNVVVDLTDNDKCYTYYLKENYNRLKKTAFSKKVDLDYYKSIVGATVQPAQWTKKKTEFIDTMNSMEDKKSIFYYIYNSIKKAESFPVFNVNI